MITVTSAQLSSWLALFVFPFVRILAMIASSPILGNKQVPVRIKIGLSILLTIIMVPTLTVQSNIEPASALGFLVLIQQLLAGLAIGFTMRLIFTAIEMAGDMIGIQMGLGLAIFYDLYASDSTNFKRPRYARFSQFQWTSHHAGSASRQLPRFSH